MDQIKVGGSRLQTDMTTIDQDCNNNGADFIKGQRAEKSPFNKRNIGNQGYQNTQPSRYKSKDQKRNGDYLQPKLLNSRNDNFQNMQGEKDSIMFLAMEGHQNNKKESEDNLLRTSRVYQERLKDQRKVVQPLFFQRQKASTIGCQTNASLQMTQNTFNNFSPQRQFASTVRDVRSGSQNLASYRQNNISRFGKDHQSSIDKLNKQNHIEKHSFFSSRRVSRTRQKTTSQNKIYGRVKTQAKTEVKNVVQNASAVRSYLESLQSRLGPESARAEMLKAHHIDQINNITRQRLNQAQDLGSGFNSINSVIGRDQSINEAITLTQYDNFEPKPRADEKNKRQIDPQILSLMSSAKDKLTQTTYTNCYKIPTQNPRMINASKQLHSRIQSSTYRDDTLCQNLESDSINSINIVDHNNNHNDMASQFLPSSSKTQGNTSTQLLQNKGGDVAPSAKKPKSNFSVALIRHNQNVQTSRIQSQEELRATAYQRLLNRILISETAKSTGAWAFGVKSAAANRLKKGSTAVGFKSETPGGATRNQAKSVGATTVANKGGPGQQKIQGQREGEVLTRRAASTVAGTTMQNTAQDSKINAIKEASTHSFAPRFKGSFTAAPPTPCKLIERSQKPTSPGAEASKQGYFYRYVYELGSFQDLLKGKEEGDQDTHTQEGKNAETQLSNELTEGAQRSKIAIWDGEASNLMEQRRPSTTQDAGQGSKVLRKGGGGGANNSTMRNYLQKLALQGKARPATQEGGNNYLPNKALKSSFIQRNSPSPKQASTNSPVNPSSKPSTASQAPFRYDLSKIKKIKPVTATNEIFPQQSRRSNGQVSMLEFMSSQYRHDSVGVRSRLSPRLAINRINLYNTTNRGNNLPDDCSFIMNDRNDNFAVNHLQSITLDSIESYPNDSIYGSPAPGVLLDTSRQYNAAKDASLKDKKPGEKHKAASPYDPAKPSTAQIVAQNYQRQKDERRAATTLRTNPVKQQLAEQQRREEKLKEMARKHKQAMRQKLKEKDVKDPPTGLKTVSQKQRELDEKRQEEQLEKLMRQINKNATWVQSDANLLDLAAVKDSVDDLQKLQRSIVHTEDIRSDTDAKQPQIFAESTEESPIRMALPQSPSRIGTGNVNASKLRARDKINTFDYAR